MSEFKTDTELAEEKTEKIAAIKKAYTDLNIKRIFTKKAELVAPEPILSDNDLKVQVMQRIFGE